MLRHTAENRNLYTPSLANYFHTLGSWLWFLSVLLQILCCALLIRQHFDAAESRDTSKSSWSAWLVSVPGVIFRRLPTPERLVCWSFRTGVLSCWWNPRWVDCCKGRAKNLVGLPSFYAAQALSLVLKSPSFLYGFLVVEDEAHRPPTQAVSLAILAVLVLYLHRASPKLIRVEHIPLFAPKPTRSASATPSSPPAEKRPPTRDGGQQTMADILDDILNETPSRPASNPAFDSPTPTRTVPIMDRLDPTPQKKAYNPNTAFMSPNPFRKQQGPQAPQAIASQNFDLAGLSISESPQKRFRQPIHYDTEMDWSPTQSQHRAFSSFQPGTARKLKFGETPVQDRPGVFWAKVPPAPTTPAQRIFNPPNAPVIRPNPPATTNTIRFQGTSGGTAALGRPQAATSPATEFAEPKLRLRPVSDERDSLADMFTRGFSLDPEPEEERQAAGAQGTQGQSSFAHNLAYLVSGLCLAVLGNWAYSYWLSLSPAMARGPISW